MVNLFDEVDEFYELDGTPDYEFDPPGAINSGYCEKFADFVRNNGQSNLKKVTTLDIVDDADNYPETEAGNIEPWHVWLTDGTFHYDAETPNGVSDWNRLPFFNREPLSKYREE